MEFSVKRPFPFDEIIDGVQEIAIQSKIGFSVGCIEFSEPHFFILKFEISFLDKERFW